VTDEQVKGVFGEPVAVFGDGSSCFVTDVTAGKGQCYLLLERSVSPKEWHPSVHITDEGLKVLQTLPPPSTQDISYKG